MLPQTAEDEEEIFKARRRVNYDQLAVDLLRNVDLRAVVKTLDGYIKAAEAGDPEALVKARFILDEIKQRNPELR